MPGAKSDFRLRDAEPQSTHDWWSMKFRKEDNVV
jgi:hypothetical protein